MTGRQLVRVLRGPRGLGEAVEAEAIVSAQGFNARYDLDRSTGLFSRPEHDLFGQSIVGKVFIFATPKGGIATSWALLDMRQRQLAPAALLCRRANPVVVQGAVLADLPLMDRLDLDPGCEILTGDWVRVDPVAGEVSVWR